MGLDIYAGTLTRYYCHNWKTVTQQWAEKNGYTFQKITPDGENGAEEQLDSAEVQRFMEGWRNQVLAALSQPDQQNNISWPEDNETPYYTNKPDWDAFGAMLLVAACYVYAESVPPIVEKGWDYTSHPLVKRLAADKERTWSLFLGATWWLPLADPIIFRGPAPNNNTVVFSTVAALRNELEALNRMVWQAEEHAILSWGDTEGYSTDGVYGPDGKINLDDLQVHTEYNTESLAKFAFSVFWQAMKFAEEHTVPILLDY